MRKLLLLLTGTFLLILNVNAQIKKGSVFLGGGINYYHSKEKDNSNIKSNGVAISPAFGITIKENIVAGIQLIYNHTKNNHDAFPEFEYISYGIELFVRKYKPLGKGFYLFGQAGLSYINNDNTFIYSSYEDKQEEKSVGMDLYPGISYAVSKKFHLEAGLADLVTLRYFNDKITSSGIVTRDRSGVDLNVNASSLSNLNIGFRVFLSK